MIIPMIGHMNLYQYNRLWRKKHRLIGENLLLEHLVHKTKPYDKVGRPVEEEKPPEESSEEKSSSET